MVVEEKRRQNVAFLLVSLAQHQVHDPEVTFATAVFILVVIQFVKQFGQLGFHLRPRNVGLIEQQEQLFRDLLLRNLWGCFS
jgi:hypothetical protein